MSPSFEFPTPVLSVAADAVRELQGGDALSSLWTLFTKCKESLQDGRRLENISWRLWYREMATNASQLSFNEKDSRKRFDQIINEKDGRLPGDPPFTLSLAKLQLSSQAMDRIPISSSTPSLQTYPALIPAPRRNSFVGQIIVDMLPNPLPPTLHPHPTPTPLHTARPTLCHLPTPESHEERSLAPIPLPTPAAEEDEPSPNLSKAAIPRVHIIPIDTPSTPPPPPRVVVVNPTPGPTPHPTPPATPILGGERRYSDALLPLPLPAPMFGTDVTLSSGSGSSSSGDSGSISGRTTISSSSSISSKVSAAVSSVDGPDLSQRSSPSPPPSPLVTTEAIITTSTRTSPLRKAASHARSNSGSSSALSPKKGELGLPTSREKPAYIRRTSSTSSVGRSTSAGRPVVAGTIQTRSKSNSTSRSRSRDTGTGVVAGVVPALMMTSARKGVGVGGGGGKRVLGAIRRSGSGRGGALGAIARRESIERGKKDKRPTFNFGSNSDEGSALGSKSTGSGSSVSPAAQPTVEAGSGKDKMKGIPEHPKPQVQQVQPPHGRLVPPRVQQQPPAVPPPPISAQLPLPDPKVVLPPLQRRTTIVLATSESDYETETDSSEDSDGQAPANGEDVDGEDGGEWSSEEISTDDVDVVIRRGGGARQPQPQAPPPAPQPNGKPPPIGRSRSSHGLLQAPAHHPSRAQQQQRQAEAARTAHVIEQAALEAQRQREMFAKKQVPSAEQLHGKRTRSVGLLSQLMNPDPQIFPPNHPYRRGFSSGEIRAGGSGAAAVAAAGQRVVAPVMARGASARPHSDRKAAPAPGMKTSKSTAAMPVSSQVQVGSVAPGGGAGGEAGGAAGVMNGSSGASGGYRPKGRPPGQEMEDDSDSGSEAEMGDGILVPKSVAQEKLKALAQRRGIVTHDQRVDYKDEDDPVPAWVREPEVKARRMSRTNTPSSSSRHQQQQRNPAPIPVGHPYNLPPPAAPSTPRTTRRLMLQTEMSESLRRNLLWERQVSKINLTGPKRSASNGAGRGNLLSGDALRPLTTTPSMVQLTAKKGGPGAQGGPVNHGERERERERRGSGGARAGEQEKEERRRKALIRNRSWAADDYHYAGW